ncbi:hypothetical protein HCN44_010169 [Aphidius gifuensis]|uniref:Uncharacterized protein n=1 Tax=Aphidius gifuensis TaxID=684658 RepID=A0A835CS58_APHGI|nr:hypothetical protein HCN44_010169 [Aphidius gifuensis]
MKVIDKSFEKLEYIIQSYYSRFALTRKLLVYPKRDELFFPIEFELWYTPNLPNSSASMLFERSKYNTYVIVFDFAIDYVTDKLYLTEAVGDDNILKSIDIGTSTRPLKEADLTEIAKIPHYAYNFVAFNNKIYYTSFKNGVYELYFKNDNETAVQVTTFSGISRLSFVSSSCPSSTAEKKEEKNHESKKDYENKIAEKKEEKNHESKKDYENKIAEKKEEENHESKKDYGNEITEKNEEENYEYEDYENEVELFR